MKHAPATHTVAVTSGKGGVGKSTVSLNLALALAANGSRVGLLDADFYGPDIPLMVNLKRTEPMRHWMLGRRPGAGALSLEPVDRHGIAIMSVGFLLAESQPLAMGAPLVSAALRQLVAGVAWGGRDYLVVDLPPGTADLQQQLLDVIDITGALVVVGPQDVAHLDARKMVALLRGGGVRVLGGVENMARLECPHCRQPVVVFPEVRTERSLWSDDVDRLVSIPLDPRVAAGGDGGRPIVLAEPDSEVAAAFRELAAAVETRLAGAGPREA